MLCKVEYYLYVVITKKYNHKTCIPSVLLARQVDVVYAYMNQGLFLNIVAVRKFAALNFP